MTNYREEVLKVYPDAILIPGVVFKGHYWVSIPVHLWGYKVPRWVYDKPLSHGYSMKEAWENAYNRINNKTVENGQQ